MSSLHSLSGIDNARVSKSALKDQAKTPTSVQNEDERRLEALGYKQEVKRIFNKFTTFGLTASMISILLGIVPLYTYELESGGPAVQFWSWIIVGCFTILLVSSLGEISCAFPTMGALYYWSFRLGGTEKHQWGPFSSWMSGWTNLLGQIAGVASGGFAGAQIFGEIIILTTGHKVNESAILGLYAVMLVVAGIVNTYAEQILTAICYISCGWQIIGTLVICIWMLVAAPSKQSAEFVFFGTNNDTGFPNFDFGYVALVGTLAAASVFTGYDTAAHVAEETVQAHDATPKAMLWAVYNAFILGLILIMSMNFCIPGHDGVNSVVSNDDDGETGLKQAYTNIWEKTCGTKATIFFLFIVLVAIECSNCANLTSAARMVYAFSRDGALPLSGYWYDINKHFGGPVRAIWLCIAIAFILGVPGLFNTSVLNALFSLTATGLYASYVIPILLRVTVAKDTFVKAEWNLGEHSIIVGWISVFWGLFMVIVLCLPSDSPVTIGNLNYSGVVLLAVLLYAVIVWFASAKDWFKGIIPNTGEDVNSSMHRSSNLERPLIDSM